MLNFSSGEEEATDEKMPITFWCVKITITGLCGKGGFVPRPKPAQNANAARRQCVLGAEFSLTVSISNTLKWHLKIVKFNYFSPGFLPC